MVLSVDDFPVYSTNIIYVCKLCVHVRVKSGEHVRMQIPAS